MDKKWIKECRSLLLKKNRKEKGQFLVEGKKSVLELLQSDIKIKALFYTEKMEALIPSNQIDQIEIVQKATEKQLESSANMKSNEWAIAIAYTEDKKLSNDDIQGELVLALDNVKDPGNLGTIIRIADWYGIRHIVCSENSADFYNPKTIASTMGSFTRITPHYQNLKAFLQGTSVPTYGALMNGENIHQKKINRPGIIVMGNESNGISPEVEEILDHRITIPSFGKAESLNVAIATAIICDNIFRS